MALDPLSTSDVLSTEGSSDEGAQMTYTWWDVTGCVLIYSSVSFLFGLFLGIALDNERRK